MSSTGVDAADPDPHDDRPPIRRTLPDFCAFYKPLLVEHFSYAPSPLQLHYGKCSLIGRTQRDPHTGRTYLLSSRLLGLPPACRCPDGTTRVQLHTLAGCAHELPADDWVRVYGEATLFDSCGDGTEIVQMTPKELVQMMAKFESDVADETQMDTSLVRQRHDDKLAELRARYIPCLTVHSFELIDQPHELLQVQLRLDAVQGRRDQCIRQQQQQQQQQRPAADRK